MPVKVMNCPSCGNPLPASAKANQLITCSACNSTLYLSDWEIGAAGDAVVVATPTRVYTITDLLSKDDLCNVYRCAYKADDKNWQGMFRIARDASENDLVQNEAKTLYHLQSSKDYYEFRPFLPYTLESFVYQDATLSKGRQVNIFGIHEGISAPNELYSLEEIHEYYPNGIDPKDMAWMWRRLLYILGFVHNSSVIHGAVIPAHILIEPKDHKLFLTGWGFSVREPAKTGNRLTAISTTYDKWYPKEVFDKQVPTNSVDLYLAARSMLYLIGGDPLDEDAEHRLLDRKMQTYFAQCVKSNPRNRPQEAWKLLAEFDGLIENLWGARTFRVFSMPYKS